MNLLWDWKIAINNKPIHKFFSSWKRVRILSQKGAKIVGEMAKLAFVLNDIYYILNHFLLVSKLRRNMVILSV